MEKITITLALVFAFVINNFSQEDYLTLEIKEDNESFELAKTFDNVYYDTIDIYAYSLESVRMVKMIRFNCKVLKFNFLGGEMEKEFIVPHFELSKFKEYHVSCTAYKYNFSELVGDFNLVVYDSRKINGKSKFRGNVILYSFNFKYLKKSFRTFKYVKSIYYTNAGSFLANIRFPKPIPKRL